MLIVFLHKEKYGNESEREREKGVSFVYLICKSMNVCVNRKSITSLTLSMRHFEAIKRNRIAVDAKKERESKLKKSVLKESTIDYYVVGLNITKGLKDGWNSKKH